jgi:hypothetical protein
MVYFGMKGESTRNWVVEGTVMQISPVLGARPEKNSLTGIKTQQVESKETSHRSLVIIARYTFGS